MLYRMSTTFMFFWLSISKVVIFLIGTGWIDSLTKPAEEVGTQCCTLSLLSWVMKCYQAVLLNEIRGKGAYSMYFLSVSPNKKHADTCKHIHFYTLLHLVIVSGLAIMNS